MPALRPPGLRLLVQPILHIQWDLYFQIDRSIAFPIRVIHHAGGGWCCFRPFQGRELPAFWVPLEAGLQVCVIKGLRAVTAAAQPGDQILGRILRRWLCGGRVLLLVLVEVVGVEKFRLFPLLRAHATASCRLFISSRVCRSSVVIAEMFMEALLSGSIIPGVFPEKVISLNIVLSKSGTEKDRLRSPRFSSCLRTCLVVRVSPSTGQRASKKRDSTYLPGVEA